MKPKSATHRRVALPRRFRNTASKSPGELLTIRSTSAVAFSRSNASFSCLVHASSFACRSPTKGLSWRGALGALLRFRLVCPCRLFAGLPVIVPPHRALRQPYHINGVRWTFGQCWVYEYTAYGAAKKLSESKTLRSGRMLRDSTLVAWYRSLYAPRTGGAYDSHHRTAGIAGRRRRGRVAARGARTAAASDAGSRVPRQLVGRRPNTSCDRIPARHPRKRVRRRREFGDRVSLGAGSI